MRSNSALLTDAFRYALRGKTRTLDGIVSVLKYQPEDLLVGMRQIAKALNRPAESLRSAFREETDILAALDAGLLAILLQIRSEPEVMVSKDVLELAEICSARLNNVAFASARWTSSEEWESVSDYFGRLHRQLDAYAA